MQGLLIFHSIFYHIALRLLLYQQHKDSEVFEPESTTLLEQCDIPGHGKFSAMSNGEIRILFVDRTSLDMITDLSQRLAAAEKHKVKVCVQE